MQAGPDGAPERGRSTHRMKDGAIRISADLGNVPTRELAWRFGQSGGLPREESAERHGGTEEVEHEN